MNDLVPQGTDSKAIEEARDHLEVMLVELSKELRQRFENPDEVKDMLAKMSVPQILSYMMRILNAVRKTQIVLPKSFQVNMQQVNNYSLEMAESEQKRKQLRSQAKKQLRYIPS